MGELPIRVIDQPGGATLRCLCGTELATLRKGLVAGQALALNGAGGLTVGTDSGTNSATHAKMSGGGA